MTHFPQRSSPRSGGKAANAAGRTPLRDVLWGRPIFKAPQLPNPRTAFDPLPFTATRITRRGRS